VPFDNPPAVHGHVRLHVGDCLDILRALPAKSFQTCVTSPPYFGLRDYGTPNQIGSEDTSERYVFRLIETLREVRRVLRDDGTLWLVIGDTYAAKSLIGIPWRVANALRDDGWNLRSEIIWAKTSVRPENVSDRPTQAHEKIFLLSKRNRYFYDLDATREPLATQLHAPGNKFRDGLMRRDTSNKDNLRIWGTELGRNSRNLWVLPTSRLSGPHPAPFPPELVRRCLVATCPIGGHVLDPFSGSGTTGVVAAQLGRNATLIDINPDYIAHSRERIGGALKQDRRRNRNTTEESPVIGLGTADRQQTRLPVTLHDLTASQVKARIRLRRAAAAYREKTRQVGNRLLSLWVHDTRTAEFRAEAKRQSELITGNDVGHHDA
jgi:site-specific DNA-methyltransferase (adenine-specific)